MLTVGVIGGGSSSALRAAITCGEVEPILLDGARLLELLDLEEENLTPEIVCETLINLEEVKRNNILLNCIIPGRSPELTFNLNDSIAEKRLPSIYTENDEYFEYMREKVPAHSVAKKIKKPWLASSANYFRLQAELIGSRKKSKR